MKKQENCRGSLNRFFAKRLFYSSCVSVLISTAVFASDVYLKSAEVAGAKGVYTDFFYRIKSRQNTVLDSWGGLTGSGSASLMTDDDPTHENRQWQIINSGRGYRIRSKQNMVLDCNKGSTGFGSARLISDPGSRKELDRFISEGGMFAMMSCEESLDEFDNCEWGLIDLGNGFYRIKSKKDTVLDSWGGATWQGSASFMTDDDPTHENRQWQFVPVIESIQAAISSKNLNAIAVLLRTGKHLTDRDYNGWTPLHVAAQVEDEKLLEGVFFYLRGDQESLLAKNNFDDTPLHVAASCNNFIFLRKSFEILPHWVANNLRGNLDNTLVHSAAGAGHTDMVNFLLGEFSTWPEEYEASALSVGGNSALDLALIKDNREIARLLIRWNTILGERGKKGFNLEKTVERFARERTDLEEFGFDLDLIYGSYSGEGERSFSPSFEDLLGKMSLFSSSDLELLERRVIQEIQKKGGVSESGSHKRAVGISISLPPVSVFSVIDSLSETIKGMERSIRGELERSGGLPRVLLLGVTGSGKTTLVHALAGKRLVTRELSSGLKALEVPDGQKLPGLVIGHRVTSSTLVPTPWQDRSAGLCYWDCPGFMDTRGPEQDIINAFAMDQLFEAPSKIKTLLVVQASELTDSRGRDVFARFDRLAKLLPVAAQLYNSTALVITKASSRFSALDVLRSMGDTPLVRFFGDHPEKVFTFPYPEEGVAWGFEDRERLIGELQSTQVTNPKHEIDLDPASIVHLVKMYKDFGDVKDRLAHLAGGMEISYRGRPLKDLQNWKRAVETILRIEDDRLGTPDDLMYQFFTVARMPGREDLRDYLDELSSSWRFNQFLMQLKEKGLIGTSLEPTHIPSVLKPYLGRLQEELTLLVANGKAIEKEKKKAADLQAALEQNQQEAAAHEAEHKRAMEAAERQAVEEKKRLQEKLDRELAQGKVSKDEVLRQIEQQKREAEAEKSRLESQWSSLRVEMERSHQSALSTIDYQRRQAETALSAVRRELDDLKRESARKASKFESDGAAARIRKDKEKRDGQEIRRLLPLLEQAKRRGDYREQQRIKSELIGLGAEFGSDGSIYLPL